MPRNDTIIVAHGVEKFGGGHSESISDYLEVDPDVPTGWAVVDRSVLSAKHFDN